MHHTNTMRTAGLEPAWVAPPAPKGVLGRLHDGAQRETDHTEPHHTARNPKGCATPRATRDAEWMLCYTVGPIALTGEGIDYFLAAVAIIAVSMWWQAGKRVRAARRELSRRADLWPLRTWEGR